MSMFGGKAFAPGGTGRSIAGYVGDALLGATGHNAVYGPAMQVQRQQQAEFQRQLALAQYKAQNPEPTDIMREAASMGLQQGTPQYNSFVRDWRMKQPMIVLGNAENGQTVLNPAQMAQGGVAGGPPADAVARLKANPHEAAQFDEIFGPGASARALGAQ